MTKPMPDERLAKLKRRASGPWKVFTIHNYELKAALDEIDRLRDEVATIKRDIASKLEAFCPPEEASVLREAAREARAEVERLKDRNEDKLRQYAKEAYDEVAEGEIKALSKRLAAYEEAMKLAINWLTRGEPNKYYGDNAKQVVKMLRRAQLENK